MPSPKSPLKPLLEHRECMVDAATLDLGSAIREREAADARRARAEAERQTAEERAVRVRAEEAARLACGELRASDLVRGHAWELSAKAELEQLTRAVSVAEQKVERTRGEEAEARAVLSRRMADRDVVVKAEGRFVERLKKRTHAAEEEAAEEAFRGGRGA